MSGINAYQRIGSNFSRRSSCARSSKCQSEGRSAASRRVSHRWVEELEQRVLLSLFTVTKEADTADGVCNADCSLREAIIAANANAGMDMIDFQAGLGSIVLSIAGAGEDAAVTGDLDINDDLQITGNGSGVTIIDAAAVDRVIHILGDRTPLPPVSVQITGVTIKGGSADTGAGVLNESGVLDISASVVSNNVAAGVSAPLGTGGEGLGGGLATLKGRVTIGENSTVTMNEAVGGNGFNGGDGKGGGIYSQFATLMIESSTVSDNEARGGVGTEQSAGGLLAGGSGFGGGIYALGGEESGTTVHITENSSITGNRANGTDLGSGEGGGIFNIGDTVNVTDSTISLNQANGGDDGGAGEGGGIYNEPSAETPGAVAILRSLVDQNQAVGGNQFVPFGTGGGAEGGGIWNSGVLSVIDSTLSSNVARGGNGQDLGGTAWGGGIYTGGASLPETVFVTRSTLSENEARGGDGNSTDGTGGDGLGGGISNDEDFDPADLLTIGNSTLSGNQANGGAGGSGGLNGFGYGGGVFDANETLQVTRIANSTITLNQASRGSLGPGGVGAGGGVAAGFGFAGTVALMNTIVAQNTATENGPDVAGSVTNQGHNLIGDGSGSDCGGTACFQNGVNGDKVGGPSALLDPELDPLGPYGGPTDTHQLQSTSPAIDMGDNAGAPLTDQRSFERIINGTIDIGSFEFGSGPIEVDEYPFAVAILTLMVDGNTHVVRLESSQALILKAMFEGSSQGSADDDDMDGNEEVETEMLQLALMGSDPTLGLVSMFVRAGGLNASLGQIEETSMNANGMLDLDPFAPVGPTADSFFDVFFDISFAGSFGHNNDPLHLDADVTHKPVGPNEMLMSAGSVVLDLDCGLGCTPPPASVVGFKLTPDPRFDFGDAKNIGGTPFTTYPTLLPRGARHVIVPGGPRLGAAAVDGESDGQPTPNADGDDLNGATPDDEGGISFQVATIFPGSQNASVNVDVAGDAGLLNAWIDFNLDGSWTTCTCPDNEQIFTDEPVVVGSNPLTFAVPNSSAVTLQTFARFRISTQAGLAPDGLAIDGEVEDHPMAINFPPQDFGDAGFSGFPGADTYFTTLAFDGARHFIVHGSAILGSSVDAENDGPITSDADGDDLNGDTPDDEDGVVFTSPLIPGLFATVDVTASADGGYLNAFLDSRNIGFWDSGERIFANELLSQGVNHLTFLVPANAVVTDQTVARFRLSTEQNLSQFGEAQDGEVEDHKVAIEPIQAGDGCWELVLKPSPEQLTLQPAPTAGLFHWSLRGQLGCGTPVDHIAEQWFYFRLDGHPTYGTREHSLAELALVEVQTEDYGGGTPGVVRLRLGNPSVGDPIQVDIQYTLDGHGGSILESTIHETVTITNVSGLPLNKLHWFEYTDLDVDSRFGNTALVMNRGHIRQFGSQGSIVDVVVQPGSPTPDHFTLRPFNNGRLGMIDAYPTTFPDDFKSGLFGHDWAHAFQWDLPFGVGQSITIEKVKDGDFEETVVPDEPCLSFFQCFFIEPVAPVFVRKWYDPAIAIGYDYVKSAGPNYATLTLPVGFTDNKYTLHFSDGVGGFNATADAALTGGVQYDLVNGFIDANGTAIPGTAGGLDSFRVLGIETDAAVDPADTLGFPTGLTFVNADPVTFSMTGIAETIYLDEAADYTITTDQGAAGLDSGDTVTWFGSAGAGDDVTGLIFGATAFDVFQDAVNAVVFAGTTIQIAPGTFTGGTIDRSLSIVGTGVGQTNLTGSSRVLSVAVGTTANISGVTITGGSELTDGGGILNEGHLMLSFSEVTSNQVTATNSRGAGIFNRGMLEISSSTISDNQGSSGTDGGGIFNDGGTATISDSTIFGNRTDIGFFSGQGGGIYNAPAGIFAITNTTISENEAADGGGIFNAGQLTIRSSTVYNNTAQFPGIVGGVWNSGAGVAVVGNTIIAGNTNVSSPFPDVTGGFATLGYNLIGDTTGSSGFNNNPVLGGTDKTGDSSFPLDPRLFPIAFNGGPTQTHLPQSDSPAVDMGNPAAPGSGGEVCPAFDQRGFMRPVDGPDLDMVATCDIGAAEFGAVPTEVDFFPHSLAGITIMETLLGSSVQLIFEGPTTIRVPFEGTNLGDANDDDSNSLDEVVTEMVQLELTGSQALPVSVRLRPGTSTFGQTEETANNVPGTLDTAPFGSGPVNSFFDVFVEIDTPGGTLHNVDPIRVMATTSAKRPGPGESFHTGPVSVNIPLFDSMGDPTPLIITFVSHVPDPLYDLSDAPTGGPAGSPPDSYPTLLADNGARHLASDLRLGDERDTETDGQPHFLALGDDDNPAALNDEDGVVFTSPFLPGGVASIEVVADADGLLDAFIDWNADGDWADAGEQVFTSEPMAGGVTPLLISVPASATVTPLTFARFRISSTGGLSFDGLAIDGEVEDYAIEIQPAGRIIVDKVTIGGDDEFSFSSDFGPFKLDGDDPPQDSGPLPLSVYDVSESLMLPSGWELTDLDCSITVTGSGTSTFDTSMSPTASITLGAGDTVTCTFENTLTFQPVTISGRKFLDTNGNGIMDTGEFGLRNWKIDLDLNNDTSVDQSAMTDGDGFYSFTNVGPGTHKVSEVLQAGWTRTAPAAPGSYLVTPTSGTNVTDRNFGNKPVSAAILTDDPVAPGKSMLLVLGTAGRDSLSINPPRGGCALGLQVQVSGRAIGTFMPTSRVVVFGGPSNDFINMNNCYTLPLFAYGEGGNDVLRGGGGPDVLVGGPGNDDIRGATGRDFISGGSGSDRLNGEQDDDIVIGGFTDFDAHDTALNAILTEWRSPAAYLMRIGHLRGTTGGGLNQPFLLTTGPAGTVHDDGTRDELTGASGRDWFFARRTQNVLDTVIDRVLAGVLAETLDEI